MSEETKSFAVRFKDLRLDKGLSQKEYGNALSVSTPSISRLEQGTATPDLDLILRIVEKYDCDLIWLATGEGNPEGNVRDSDKRQMMALLKRDQSYRAEVLSALGLRPSTEVLRHIRVHEQLKYQRADWLVILECLIRSAEGASGAEMRTVESKISGYQEGVAYLNALLEVGRDPGDFEK